MISEATPDDLPRIVQMGARFHKAAKLDGAFMPQTFWSFCEYLLNEDCGVIFVSPAGMIGGHKSPLPWCCNFIVAREAFWWSEDGQGRALMAKFEEWASDADQIRMALLGSLRPAAVARVLSQAGYEAAEIEMVKAWS